MAKDPWIANKIIQSICPAITGHEEIKEAIALQLFGSDPLELPDGTRIRGDTHLLLTGDPGTAKSQILKWVGFVAPRGLYTSGMKATGAGLTAAAVRDELGGGWTLEAGALVIADGGLASIDEFEKMSADDSAAILESMEQQTISIAKAGIVATLNTRTAVLAATNPKAGRFDPNTPITQQLALDPVLLSRFDLMFIMKDEPKVEDDRAIASHVVQIHSEPTRVIKPPIDSEFLRKIIIYARKKIHPSFDDKEAHKVITDFYVDWRKAATMQGRPLPITVRQLEALIRLAKAYARLRLSDRVTKEDATRAKNLVRKSLEQFGMTTEGFVDVDLIVTGMSKSQREKALRLFDIIQELEAEHRGPVPIEKVKEKAMSEGISEKFVEFLINKEKDRGTLYSPSPHTVARVK
jgi:replicative DNA helicase Mcm